MINLEHIQQLDSKVKEIVELIESLREENTLLKEQLAECENQLNTVSTKLFNRENDEERIEEGLKNVLDTLEKSINVKSTEEGESSPSHYEEIEDSSGPSRENGQENNGEASTEQPLASETTSPGTGPREEASDSEPEDVPLGDKEFRAEDRFQTEFDIF